MEENLFSVENFLIFTDTYADEYSVVIGNDDIHTKFKSELHVRL